MQYPLHARVTHLMLTAVIVHMYGFMPGNWGMWGFGGVVVVSLCWGWALAASYFAGQLNQ